jgi:hypothetical protein
MGSHREFSAAGHEAHGIKAPVVADCAPFTGGSSLSMASGSWRSSAPVTIAMRVSTSNPFRFSIGWLSAPGQGDYFIEIDL